MLPDGVAGFRQILDTGIVGSLALLTGALPAQYGLRTAGVLDIQTKTDAFNNSGSVSVYGGSHGTITPSFEYGGIVGKTQYFVSGRYLSTNLGIENPTPRLNAIHDHSRRKRFFAYTSDGARSDQRLVTLIGCSARHRYQIPNNPGRLATREALAVPDGNPTMSQLLRLRLRKRFRLSTLNENQNEFNHFNVVAYQKSSTAISTAQLSYFNRYSQSALHARPDRRSRLQRRRLGCLPQLVTQRHPGRYLLSAESRAHTLRVGFSVSGEQTLVNNTSTVQPLRSH